MTWAFWGPPKPTRGSGRRLIEWRSTGLVSLKSRSPGGDLYETHVTGRRRRALFVAPAAWADSLRIQAGSIDTTAATGPLSGSERRPEGFVAARADYGTLGVQDDLLLSAGALSKSQGEVGSFAKFLATYTFNAPGEFAMSMNLDLEGRIDQSSCISVNLDCVLELDLSVEGFGAFGVLVASNGVIDRPQLMFAPVANQFTFDGSRFKLHLTTPTVAFSPGAHDIGVTLAVGLRGSATGGSISESVDLLNTLSFPVGGLAFNLPAGVTVSGPGLVDNCFGGAAACSPQANDPVPEPATLALLGSGLVGSVARRPRGRGSQRLGSGAIRHHQRFADGVVQCEEMTPRSPRGVSHDRREETPAAKACWFQSLTLTERMDILCSVTDLALMANPRLPYERHAQSTSGRIRVLESA